MAQEAYYELNKTYADSIENLAGSVAINVTDGVTILFSKGDKAYTLVGYHSSGNKTYTLIVLST